MLPTSIQRSTSGVRLRFDQPSARSPPFSRRPVVDRLLPRYTSRCAAFQVIQVAMVLFMLLIMGLSVFQIVQTNQVTKIADPIAELDVFDQPVIEWDGKDKTIVEVRTIQSVHYWVKVKGFQF